MFLIVLRGLFVLVLLAVAMSFIAGDEAASIGGGLLYYNKEAVLLACAGLAVLVVAADIYVPRKSLSAISGVFFGLIVGMVVAWGLSLIVDLLVESFFPALKSVGSIKLLIGVICCYLSVSFILQTKDDVRFVIPYVEFSKQTKGARPLILDTSVIIDGRIADIADTRILESEVLVPRFVLNELQAIADSGDKLKRNRGRRGLDMLNKLQTNDKIDIRILDVRSTGEEAGMSVDEKLVELAKKLDGRVVTNDYNLNKIAQLRGVDVININDVANALKPVFLPGEAFPIKVIKPGESYGQGVGYLEDGTMVVVEGGRDHIGETINIMVTSVLQTSAGRMVFGRLDGVGGYSGRRPRPSRPQTPVGARDTGSAGGTPAGPATGTGSAS